MPEDLFESFWLDGVYFENWNWRYGAFGSKKAMDDYIATSKAHESDEDAASGEEAWNFVDQLMEG